MRMNRDMKMAMVRSGESRKKPTIYVSEPDDTVEHIHGSDCQKPSSSWLKCWETHARKSRGECCEIDCNRDAAHGAHVKECAGYPWMIVPTCRSHNVGKNGQTMYIKEGTTAVCCHPTLMEEIYSSLQWLKDTTGIDVRPGGKKRPREESQE